MVAIIIPLTDAAGGECKFAGAELKFRHSEGGLTRVDKNRTTDDGTALRVIGIV